MQRNIFGHKSKLSPSVSNSTDCCEDITTYNDDELLKSPAKQLVKKRGLLSFLRFPKKPHSKHSKVSSVQPLCAIQNANNTAASLTTTVAASTIPTVVVSTVTSENTRAPRRSSVLNSLRIMRKNRKSKSNPSESKETTKSLATKRHTPEGANLSISEMSLLNIDARDNDEDDVATDNECNQSGKGSGHSSNNATTANPILDAQQEDRFPVHETRSEVDVGEAAERTKSENKTHDMPAATTGGRDDRWPIEVDAKPISPSAGLPHNVSEVAITKVSVASLSSVPSSVSQTNSAVSRGAIKKTITTSSHHQTRREIFEIPPSMSKPVDGCIDRANLNPRRRAAGDKSKTRLLNEVVVLENVVGDERGKEVDDHCELSDSESLEQLPKVQIQIDSKIEPIMSATTSEKREHLYKILVIGELGTGKTSFIKRYVHQFFSQNYRATIGVDFALKVLNWDQNTIIRLQLWDIAGQERFGNMTRVYYKEAVGAFIVFDITRSATFDAVVKWKQDLDSKVQLPNGSSIPCILLANKCDQPKNGLVSNAQKMDEYVKQNGFAGWFETSAKENVNIEEAARALVNNILLNDKMINTEDIADADKFGLTAPDNRAKKNNCAC